MKQSSIIPFAGRDVGCSDAALHRGRHSRRDHIPCPRSPPRPHRGIRKVRGESLFSFPPTKEAEDVTRHFSGLRGNSRRAATSATFTRIRTERASSQSNERTSERAWEGRKKERKRDLWVSGTNETMRRCVHSRSASLSIISD